MAKDVMEITNILRQEDFKNELKRYFQENSKVLSKAIIDVVSVYRENNKGANISYHSTDQLVNLFELNERKYEQEFRNLPISLKELYDEILLGLKFPLIKKKKFRYPLLKNLIQDKRERNLLIESFGIVSKYYKNPKEIDSEKIYYLLSFLNIDVEVNH